MIQNLTNKGNRTEINSCALDLMYQNVAPFHSIC